MLTTQLLLPVVRSLSQQGTKFLYCVLFCIELGVLKLSAIQKIICITILLIMQLGIKMLYDIFVTWLVYIEAE